jgi:hypothetical protein
MRHSLCGLRHTLDDHCRQIIRLLRTRGEVFHCLVDLSDDFLGSEMARLANRLLQALAAELFA